jgi:uncharacterized protein (TIGR03382 family)
MALLLAPVSAIASIGSTGDAGDPGLSVPLACDGGLCDTTNGGGCGTAGPPSASDWALALTALALVSLRRRAAYALLGKEGPK